MRCEYLTCSGLCMILNFVLFRIFGTYAIIISLSTLYSDLGDAALLHMGVAVSGILAPRLLLNIRKRYYGPVLATLEASEILFAVAGPRNDGGDMAVRALNLRHWKHSSTSICFPRTPGCKIAFSLD